MQGAVFFGDRKAGLREFPEPEPGPGEVVVAVRASGMCGSDLHYYRSTPGSVAATSGQVIMGHEPAGVVHAVGPGVPADIAAVGDRVMIHHYAGCTRCDSCRTGWPQMCTRKPVRYFGTHEHGGHAPLLKVPACHFGPTPRFPQLRRGCGDRLRYRHGMGRPRPARGRRWVHGGGVRPGPGRTVSDLARHRQGSARDRDRPGTGPARAGRALRRGRDDQPDGRNDLQCAARSHRRVGVPLILETSGASAAIADALGALAPWGRVCLIGLGGEARFKVGDLLHSQMTLMTSWTLSLGSATQVRRVHRPQSAAHRRTVQPPVAAGPDCRGLRTVRQAIRRQGRRRLRRAVKRTTQEEVSLAGVMLACDDGRGSGWRAAHHRRRPIADAAFGVKIGEGVQCLC